MFLPVATPYPDASIHLLQTKPGFIREGDLSPLLSIPSAISCAKLAPKSHVTLVKLRLFSRFSETETEPRSPNSIPDSLHRDATCTWFPLLSQHSLQTGVIHKASPCYSDCNVSVFMLDCNFWSSRSGSVRNSLRCSMMITKSNNGATMNVELVSNILWVNCRLYTTQSLGSFFIRIHYQSSKRPCICHNNIDNSNAILVILRKVFFNKKIMQRMQLVM